MNVIYRKERSDGSVMHATIRIGDSMLMLAEATSEWTHAETFGGLLPTSKTYHPRNKRNVGRNSADKQAQLRIWGALIQITL